MAIIDSIKIGQPMPAIIPDQEARGDDIEKIKSVDIGRSMTYCFTYIPYYPNNINYAVLDARMRDAISSRFTGCLMVAWEEGKAAIAAMAPIAGCEWRMPSMKDWEMIVFGNYVERSGRVVCNDFWSMQIGTGFEDFHENYYWSSDEVEDHGEKKFRVMTFRFEGEDMIADFGMGSHYPNQKHIVRAVLAHNM